jgi:hypothetical protein
MPQEDLVRQVDELLNAGGALVHLWPMVSNSSHPMWFRPWLSVEEMASRLRIWEPMIIPGLLQVEGYARAILMQEPDINPSTVEDRVAKRISRQRILYRESPPILSVIIDEGVLRRPIGGTTVMQDQLKFLLNVSDLPHVSLQVVPYESGSASGLLGAFQIAEAPGSLPTVYYESTGSPQVVSDPEQARAANVRFDAIRADAHPRHVSARMIKEVTP